jgi:hypothetical protein
MNINRFGKGAEFEDGVLQVTRVNFLGARGIEVVVTVDHFRQFLNGLQLTTGKGVVASALGIGIGGQVHSTSEEDVARYFVVHGG